MLNKNNNKKINKQKKFAVILISLSLSINKNSYWKVEILYFLLIFCLHKTCFANKIILIY